MKAIKIILIMALLAACFAGVISGIDNPKPNKLATTITREIKEMMK